MDANPDFELEQLEQIEQAVHSDEYADQLESDAEHWHNAEQMEQEPNATSYCDTEPAFFEPVNSLNNPPEEGGLPKEKLCGCGCTSMTAGDVFLMTVGLGLRHNLTWAAQVDILKMANQLFNLNPLKATKYYYEKAVCSGNIAVDTYLYCPDCGVSLGKVEQQLNPNIVCTCKKVVSKQSTLFLSLSLEDQFKNLLRDPVFAKDLMSHRFDRKKNGDDSLLRDIFDGAAYRKLFDSSGPLSKPKNFSLSFNTDGVSAGKSNSVNRTMWPILVTINELPYSIRNKYVLIAGLYVGKTHPNMDAFLEPFVEQLNRLSSAGFEWTNSDHKVITSRVYPLCAVVDSPDSPAPASHECKQ
ncbi:uncharacterized protein LOC127751342 [Frankliniella occidentalis]|uniref:Uncharacterized protein LOC127751342 n=1 Tax=Frankliniella occidentalis TaxID=133901 RepID=A0A9C6X7T3_FRAOC|nr:uncharacterized protein LOC127751342 [Frankliniella occidentalis]